VTDVIDFTKKHNYLIVYDYEGGAHYLDRYAPAYRTLCDAPADPTEIEHDPLGYLGGIDCAACRAELERRVLA
jgi:hypothetical protein